MRAIALAAVLCTIAATGALAQIYNPGSSAAAIPSGLVNAASNSYGNVKCDGVTNDAPALNAIIAGITAATGGGSIYVPQSGNDCILASTVTIPGNVYINCAVHNGTHFVKTFTGIMFNFLGTAGNRVHQSGIANCVMDGSVGHTGALVHAQYADHIYVNHVRLS